MKISDLLNDKTKKTREKTDILSKALLKNEISIQELISFAEIAKDPAKATCIEALEFATKQNSTIADKAVFQFVTKTLAAKTPRVKWESARVIGNTAHLFRDNLDNAIVNLLVNSEHEGTVVRWSSAFALGEILKLKTRHNKELLPTIEIIIDREEKSSIKKIYLAAIKKCKKAD